MKTNINSTIVMVLASTLITLNSMAQFGVQNKDNILVVKGVAILQQIPELINARIVIKAEALSYKDCHSRLLSQMEKVKSTFLKCNIDNDLIKSDQLMISEDKRYKDINNWTTLFIGSATFTIETNYSIDFTQNLLAALKQDSLSLHYSVSFKLSEAQKAYLRENAITKAISDAKEKAISIAKSSEVNLVRINSIKYLDESGPWGRDWDIQEEEIVARPFPSTSVRGGGSERPTIDFNPKEIGIIKTIEIEWIINDKN